MSTTSIPARLRHRLGAGLALLALAGAAQAGPLGYSLTGTVQYTFGCGSGNATVGSCGSPDTGWLRFTNTGASSFTGSATLSGVAPGQTINLTIVGALAPGESWVFNAGPESSNVGGFNKQAGLADLGLLFSVNGTVDGGALAASIYDSQIHSGVFATNPFGESVDSWVLQGGDPFGRDTGDNFETAQAAASFVWSARGTGTVPEPGALPLVLLATLGALAARRRRG